MRLVSFVGSIAGDAQRQAMHFKWGLKKWVLDRIVNNEYVDVAQVCAAAHNIELLNEGGSSNKRGRDGDRIQNRESGQQDRKLEHVGRDDKSYDLKGSTDRRQESRGQDQRTSVDREVIDRAIATTIKGHGKIGSKLKELTVIPGLEIKSRSRIRIRYLNVLRMESVIGESSID